MKKIKRIISLLIVFSLVLVLGLAAKPAKEVSAVDTAYTDSGDAAKTGRYKVNEISEINYLPYGVIHYKHQGESTSDSIATGADVDGIYGPSTEGFVKGQYYAQQVNVLEVPSTPGVKLVPWMNYTGNKWNLTTVRNFILDFEAKNPEWTIIGGINGDGFDISKKLAFPAQSNGVTISNGDFFKSTATSIGIMGFIRDGRQNESSLAFVGASTANNSLITVVDVYDANDNIISRHSIHKHNSAPEVGQSSVYYGIFTNSPASYTFYPKEVDANAYFYGVGSAEIWLPNHENNGDFYGKGIISTTDKGSLSTLERNQFAICTMDADLKEALAVGVKVRVQRVYSGSYAHIDNAISVFGGRILNNGVTDAFQAGTRHPRTFLGVKADGTICLMVADGRNGLIGMHGVDGHEMAAMLRRYGCVRGYNLDGGGSSTLIIKDENGNIVVKNKPSDGWERTDGNCLFVAVRKPKVNVIAKAETRKLTLRVNVQENLDHDINKLYVSLNNERKEVVDGVVTFDRLQPGTEYEYQLSYSDSNNLSLNMDIKGKAQTNYNKPELKGIKCVEDADSFDFTINYRDSNNISNFGVAPIIVNGHEYLFVDGAVSIPKSEVGDAIETCVVKIEYLLNAVDVYKQSVNNAHLAFALPIENMYAAVENLIKDIY